MKRSLKIAITAAVVMGSALLVNGCASHDTMKSMEPMHPKMEDSMHPGNGTMEKMQDMKEMKDMNTQPMAPMSTDHTM